ncbi:hypothetical protein [Flavisolibacter ginsenosidimutans]|uniref:Uncharacterized protein n=1 Tax=Flavisolibacter ginsenosidimutans TaxID=661481 RepID=A0A5B8UM56_9BACT|nr:hypothetical protein [Flavisolibacter ginsenosidimutans]QEC57761.1 hypothetical protein FSB75_18245 [Flavisolibacter ginsenosidimutans]
MKRDFTHENFEDFLKRSADGLRMKAPDKVWQNLSKELNKRRRRFAFGLSALLLISSASGYYIINSFAHDKISTQQPSHPAIKPGLQTGINKEENTETTGTTGAKVISMQPRIDQQTAPGFNALENSGKVIALNFDKQLPNIKKQEMTGTETEPESVFTPITVDAYTDESEVTAPVEAMQGLKKSDETFPFTIESVINSYKPKSKHFETQLYFTPTISYRKLAENKSYLRGLTPSAIPAGYPALGSSVNSYVTHKPAIGFEAGFVAKYLLSNSVRIRSGLQFNVNRYDVKAFSSSGSIATIALNNGSGIDSLHTYSTYSNLSGYKSDWLQNLSFQLSAPVGVEYLFKGTDKMRFGLATTVQPTYILGDRAYLITTDYKNYIEVPWLIRRWNVNTAFETFVTLQGAKTKWQIGPQVRYQLLSSFISKYPVKENLFDFGLKVGVTLNK